jgi:hypothetical protein
MAAAPQRARGLVIGPDVYGPAEARELVGVSKQRFGELAGRDGFPAPRVLTIGRVWDGPELRAWAADRQDGRAHGTRTRAVALRRYRQTGSIAGAARSAGVDPATVRRWMRDIAVPLPRDAAGT